MSTLLQRLEKRKKDKEESGAKVDTKASAPKRATPPPRKEETNIAEAEPTRATPPPRKQTSTDVVREQSQQANLDKSVQYIDVDLIDVETQVRKTFDEDYIQDLCLDFILNEEAPFQPDSPVTVYQRDNGRFLLEAGENRLRAVKFGRDHRNELGITDPTAFTIIRATVKSSVPTALKKTQKQVKENVLRSDLTYAELAQALQQFFAEHPKATQADAVAWCGFRNANSGRVKVNKALKLLDCDADLQTSVANNELSIDKAFKEQDARKQATATLVAPAQKTTQPVAKKAPAKKHEKKRSISMEEDTLLEILQVLNWSARQAGIAWDMPEKPSRKDVLALLNSAEFAALKEKAR